MSEKKKGPRILRALHVLGVFSGFLFVYPLCYLAWFLRGEPSDAKALLAMAGAAVCGFAGAGLRLLFERKRLLGLFSEIALLLFALLCAAGAFILAGGEPLPGLLVALACLAACVIGERLVLLPYDAVTSRTYLLTGIGVYAGCAVLMYLAERLTTLSGGGYLSLAALLFVFLSIHEAAANQAQIDFLMQRRSHRMDQLPSRIRRYNLTLVVLILAVILCGLLFYRQVGAGLSFLLETLRQLVSLIFRFFTFLYSLIPKSEGTEEEIPAAEQGDFPFPAEETQTANTDWITYLLIAGFIALIVWKRRAIAQALRSAVAALLAWLRSLFTVRRRTREEPEEDGYYDEVEELARESGGFRLFAPSAARLWKREWSALRKTPDSTEKLRQSYALLARGLTLLGVRTEPCDTPAELLRRAERALSGTEAEAAFSGYERVRYDDRDASAEELGAMQSLLAAVARQLSGKSARRTEARPG